MNTLKKIPDKGDPSDILQLFPKYNLQLLCCRYWWLTKWEFRELSFPYWRIYYNNQSGAFLNHREKEFELNPSNIYLISPNTSYSTHLFDHKIPLNTFSIEGGRIGDKFYPPPTNRGNFLEHLFIHFNIGMPYDNISQGIFSFPLTDHIKDKITIITNHLSVNSAQFSFYPFLAIQSLIADLLNEIDESNWDLLSNDSRIISTLSFIEHNIKNNLTNEKLAEQCHMATNSFTRLFTEEIGLSPQRYIKKKRIDTACIQLHHTDKTIDKIADATGFANRYHFSRIFKKTTGISPAKYRKEYGM